MPDLRLRGTPVGRRAAAYPQLRIVKLGIGTDSEIPRILIKLPGYSARETDENVTVLLTEQNVDGFLSARAKAGEQFNAVVKEMTAARTKAFAKADADLKPIQRQLKQLDAQERAAYQVDAPALSKLIAREKVREQPFRDRLARVKREMAQKVEPILNEIDQQRENAAAAVRDLVPEYVRGAPEQRYRKNAGDQQSCLRTHQRFPRS